MRGQIWNSPFHAQIRSPCALGQTVKTKMKCQIIFSGSTLFAKINKTKLCSGPATSVHSFIVLTIIMQRLDRSQIVGVDVIMYKFNTPTNITKCAQNIGCTCSMCEQSSRTKFEYKGILNAGVIGYTNQTPPPNYFGWINCLSSTSLKMRNHLSNVHKIEGAHAQCMNNHFAKFEY